MARKKELGIFDMLMEMPWWVGVIVAAIAYVLISAVVPRMLADNAILKSFVGICPTTAKMVALLDGQQSHILTSNNPGAHE